MVIPLAGGVLEYYYVVLKVRIYVNKDCFTIFMVEVKQDQIEKVEMNMFVKYCLNFM